MQPVTSATAECVWWTLDVTGPYSAVDKIHSKGNNFVTGVKIKTTVDSKHKDGPVSSNVCRESECRPSNDGINEVT